MVLTVAAIGGGFMLLERIIPDQVLPKVSYWWTRVIFINLVQLGIVLLGGLVWDTWFQQVSVFSLGEAVPAFVEGVIGYVITTFIFYWWHRWRHDSDWLWLGLHQLHHSASRIETITSFFKHPLEILCNALITGVLAYTLLGLTLEGVMWLTFFTGVGEYIYHMNIRTPHWLGYFFQRPEMHRIHHRKDKHYNNFSDLPLWDMLFGTYENPKNANVPCGFTAEQEARFWDILKFRNVNPVGAARKLRKGLSPAARKQIFKAANVALILIGTIQFVGYFTDSKVLRGIGFATAASPLPLVFSHFRGTEPFSSRFDLEIHMEGGFQSTHQITPSFYSQLSGPYNRRNVYGAAIAGGPALQSASEKQLWQSVLHYGFCKSSRLQRDFRIEKPVTHAIIHVTSSTPQPQTTWKLEVSCNR